MSEELYKQHRPQLFKQVVGQREACQLLAGFCNAEGGVHANLPHALLLTGPSGTGKTTLARILRTRLKCGDPDFVEINASDFRGVDTIREIRQNMTLSPLAGPCRVYLVDECHKLTGDAQNAFLKMLEDTPPHVWFFLCTTDPQRLLKTIITRCTEIKLAEVGVKELGGLVVAVATEEGIVLAPEVVARIAEVSEGSPRKALVLLNQLRHAKPDDHLGIVARGDYKAESIELARLLLNPRATWQQVATVLRGLGKKNKGDGAKDDEGREYNDSIENPEGLRWLVLAYMGSVLLGGGQQADRAYRVIQIFRDNWFDCKKAGLLACCYEVVNLQGGK